ncbi:hypothetical protein HG535_0B00670 [Zygotorulaspora mrakii]|uniref:phosphoserine phosphatase n=1 Tax=Zygotorulaspora mrakii TaxID=42260 RepID=A0A7H9AZA2_ZYGMR|nr:uncharacterized protein HG535_0B00670 [Zygotorulaspora mrakii]QLG71029.1 hypothetical protein HG535_0B00670 [Zygotorulaspora mrakii]
MYTPLMKKKKIVSSMLQLLETSSHQPEMSSFVITCISHEDVLNLEKRAEISKKINAVLSSDGYEVESEQQSSENAFDIYVENSNTISLKEFHLLLKEVIDSVKDADLIVQLNNKYRQKKLIVFDMDSTLIYQEVIELIAAYANVEDKVREITERAMNNELDFKQSLQERVKLLKGLKIDDLYDQIKSKLEITKGVPELCQALHNNGCKLAVLSGGFIPFAKFIKEQLNLDYAEANILETDSDGLLTGFTKGTVVDGQYKAETLLRLCKEFDIPVEASCMVGDGGNDLPAMNVAGFGVAWNAKPRVQELAPSKLNTKSMINLLHVFGYLEI